MNTTDPLPRPKQKLLASLKLALFFVAIFVPARLLTVKTAAFEDEWSLYIGFFVFVAAGMYLSITFALWADRKFIRKQQADDDAV